MKRALSTFVLLVVLTASGADAAQRSFVSAIGNDADACSVSSPCRSFGRALSVTDAAGEIVVLDSGGYGSVVINKSISIVAPEGVYAGITVTSGTGVSANPGVGGKVVLRGLTINGLGGTTGISVSGGAEIHIQRCTISNMSGTGISVSGAGAVHVSGSELRSNAGTGIWVFGGAAQQIHVSDTRIVQNGSIGVVTTAESRIVLDHVDLSNNVNGGFSAQPATGTTVRLVMRDSTVAGNGGSAVSLAPTNAGTAAHGTIERSVFTGNSGVIGVNTQSIGTASLVVDRCVVNDNQFAGIFASGTNATIHVRDSVVTRNGEGLHQQTGAVLNSCGNNLIAFNANSPGVTTVACTQ
jgi:hypothetical protein